MTNRGPILAAMVIMAGIVEGCHSENLDRMIIRMWALHGDGKHGQLLRRSSEILSRMCTRPEDRCVCLFLRADSLRQLQRYEEAHAVLDQATGCSDGAVEVLWLDRGLVGSLLLEPQLRLCGALAKAQESGGFPETEEEYSMLMHRYYGGHYPFADEVAAACATACISKRKVMNRAN